MEQVANTNGTAPTQRPVRGTGRPKLYKLADGTRVPSVTTITKRFSDSGGLIQWAYQQGIEGVPLYEKRDDAAASGGIAHDMIEAWIHGDTEKAFEGTPEQLDKGRWALERFKAWIASKRIAITHTEVPLVSEQHKFGGTLDALARNHNVEIVLADWKTGGGVYPDFVVQLGGYSILVRECLGLTVQAALLLRFDKEVEASSEHMWGRSVIEEAESAFLAQRELYEQDRFFKRVCK